MNLRNRNLHPHSQRLSAAGVLWSLCSMLAACEAPQSSSGEVPQEKVASSAPAVTSQVIPVEGPPTKENPDIGKAIKLDMSYTELRASMEAHGWKPVAGEFCLVNTVGPNHKAFCAEHPDSQTCGYCSQLPGLVQWSADGHVLFWFEHAPDRKQLEVGMYGELENWKYNAPDTMLGVSGWRYKLESGD